MPDSFVELPGAPAKPSSDKSSSRQSDKTDNGRRKSDRREREKEKGGLSDSQRDRCVSTTLDNIIKCLQIFCQTNTFFHRFEDMLRNLMPDRNPIAETMVWCIEHADAWQVIILHRLHSIILFKIIFPKNEPVGAS